MTNDRFEAVRIIGSIIFFVVFVVLLPSKKKAKVQKKNTTTLQKVKRLKAEIKKSQNDFDPPTATFGDTTGWHEGGKPKVPFFRNRNSDLYVDESVDYEVSFDVGGRRKNPPQGFDR